MYKILPCALLLAAGLMAGTTVSAQTAMQPAGSNAGGDAYPTAPRDPSLKPVFEQFGGKPGLVALMNDFMDNLMADPVTRPFFQNADREHIKVELVDQFCVILDGPCSYTGKDMASVHRGMNVDRADFNALVEDLQKAMSKHDIPFRAQNKLLAKLAPMNRQIITKP
ncbi:globin [Rhodanobacter sp. C06]|uniref:group I truncated hemoglobin n=1 Tax=Rhodanobacter sp. C06 TaxID=1945854 RepID=UPI0009878B61|nr:group 1 truncated hemoglobin [Rhodanobacter sp. C06]OOG41765.1 globin [Rhodanobacter sp. C06]